MSKEQVNYQKLQEQLDNLINQLQSGQLSLDESLAIYKQAEDIIGQLEGYLKTAKNNVEKVTLNSKAK